MLGSIIGGIIGAAGSLLGGEKSKDAAADAAMMNYLSQKEFAQHGIRWRVEDAKAAGLHPLYALGGAGASFSPSFTVSGEGAGIADAGQHLGRAATAAFQPSEKALLDAQLNVLRAQARKDDALAFAAESEAARRLQEANVSKPIRIEDQRLGWSGAELHKGAAFDSPDAVFTVPLPTHNMPEMPLPPEAPPAGWISDKPVASAWDQYQVAPNAQMLLPAGGSMSEALESISEGLLLGALIVGMNSRHYGPGWLTAMADHTGVPLRAFEEALAKFNRMASGGGRPVLTTKFGTFEFK